MRMRTAFFLASVIGFCLFALGVWAFADSYLRIAQMTEIQQVASRVVFLPAHAAPAQRSHRQAG